MFTSEFEKTATMEPVPSFLLPKEKDVLPKPKNPLALNTIQEGYQVLHSPGLEGLKHGAKWAVPTALIASLASPSGVRARNAAVLGTLAGLIGGIPAALSQAYDNKLEDAHVKFHLDRIKNAVGE